MKLYRTKSGPVVQADDRTVSLTGRAWDDLVNLNDLREALLDSLADGEPAALPAPDELLPPIGRQELWASGVTYYRSRTARMEEAKTAGGSDFYDRVYHAERPEIFFKAPPRLVVGPGGTLKLRRDSQWIVPEPELTLLVGPEGRITAYTVGNDLSCRDIEGENPLYLPQAKTFDACAALGPCLWVPDAPPPRETEIQLDIRRDGETVFEATTDLSQMKRDLDELVGFLYAETTFPDGCLLMTGTGIVPPDDFSLEPGDEVRITIPPIGTLVNPVA